MERKRIYLSSPTMHGEEQAFVQSAFDTNWVAPLVPTWMPLKMRWQTILAAVMRRLCLQEPQRSIWQ